MKRRSFLASVVSAIFAPPVKALPLAGTSPLWTFPEGNVAWYFRLAAVRVPTGAVAIHGFRQCLVIGASFGP